MPIVNDWREERDGDDDWEPDYHVNRIDRATPEYCNAREAGASNAEVAMNNAEAAKWNAVGQAAKAKGEMHKAEGEKLSFDRYFSSNQQRESPVRRASHGQN